MSATAHQRRGRGGATEFVPSGGEYQLTELKNVSTARANSTNTVDFSVRLVRAVRTHPCFYDTSNAHYGTRHQDAQFRATAWQQAANSMGFSGGTQALSQQWKRLKERYTKERREGVAEGEEPLDDGLMAEMAWLDEYVLGGMPAPAAVAPPPSAAVADPRSSSMYYMDGEEDLLGDDFVDQHEVVEEEEEGGYTHGLGDDRRGGSPAGSAHSGTGSDVDVGGVAVGGPPPPSTISLCGGGGGGGGRPKDSKEGIIGGHGPGGSSRIGMSGARQHPTASSSGAPAPHSYRFVSASSASHQPHHPAEGITVSSRGNGTLIAHPKREGSVGGGSTLTMVIDPTTYYQNGTQKMYRLVNVADLDSSSTTHLQPLQQVQHSQHAPSDRSGLGGGGGGGGGSMMGEPSSSLGFSIGRGTRKRMGAPLSPPSSSHHHHHHHSAGGLLGGPSSSSDLASPFKSGIGQLGDDLILDDGIVGENTIVIDHQRDDESPLLVDSPGMHHHHHHHMMMGGPGGGGQRGMHHRAQHSPTLLGNGSGARSAGGGYSPGLSNQGPSNAFNTSQYDADLALQHFISSHLARMNEDDKALTKLNIQRILLDARFGTGSSLRVCLEDAELQEAAVASEMVAGE